MRITKRSIFALILSILSFFYRVLALLSILVAIKDILRGRKNNDGRHILSVVAIAISCLLFIGKNVLINHLPGEREFEIADKAAQVYTIDEEIYKNIESDITGYSLYDKASLGLDVEDNSDTDGDGLTDKEEIEEYGTDPLKMSSAGDLIPDGYKVYMGLPLNDKYDLNTCNFEEYGLKDLYSSPENITIDNADVNNAYASIYEHCPYIDSTKAVAGYDFVDVEGNVSVDFSEFIDDDSDYTAYLETLSGEIKELPISDGMVYGTLDGGYGNISIFDKYALLQNNEALLFVPSGWLGELWDYRLNGGKTNARHIYIIEKSSRENNPERGVFLSQKFSERFGKNIVVHHEYLPGLEFEAKKAAYDLVLTLTKIGDKYWECDDSLSEGERNWSYAIKKVFSTLYVYQHLEADNWNYSEAAVVQIAYEGEGLSYYTDMVRTGKFWQVSDEKKGIFTNFDLINDTFAFYNFSTGINGGNCAGFAKFIASRYNEDYLDRKLSDISIRYLIAGKGIIHGYDLSDTMYDAMFDKTISLKTIPQDDNVKNALTTQWAILNEDVSSIKSKKNYNASVIDHLKNYLQTDRIAIVSIYGKNAHPNLLKRDFKNGHAINVYGIEETYDPNVIYLLVYDCNASCSNDTKSYRDAFRLKIRIIKNFKGDDEFEFYYDANGGVFSSGEKEDVVDNKGIAFYDCAIRFILVEGGTVEDYK